ncbi:MAG TPA: substrate-binding domain-containing protein [Gemmatimonadales bacterium]|nr:substrate-binding domain-containing protein [Gemmatimonadales bacterium]
MTQRNLGALALALLAVSTVSCGKKKHDRPQVGVTLLTEAHVFYQNLKLGLQQGADSLGVDLHVVAGEWDLARQTSQVQNFVTQGMDAIVVAPVNSSGIVSAIEDANHAHIPVFTADISADGGQVAAHVASDNVQGGRLLGEYVASRLKGGGNVAILDQPTVASVRDRVTGFTDALAKYPNIRILARPAVERGLRDVAKQKMDNLLTTDQHIDAVFGTNDDCALGALAAIQAAGTKNIFVVGYDATPEARTEIASGTALVADAVQDPVTIGRRTIETVVQVLKGQSVPSVIPVPVGLVTRDSLTAKH